MSGTGIPTATATDGGAVTSLLAGGMAMFGVCLRKPTFWDLQGIIVAPSFGSLLTRGFMEPGLRHGGRTIPEAHRVYSQFARSLAALIL